MIFAFITIDAQISFGVAAELQSTEVDKNWPGWVEASNPILIYIDLGFGFIAIENGYRDRFIINSLEPLPGSSERTSYVMKCVDKSKKQCTIRINHFRSGNTAVEVLYNDIKYAYLVNSEMDASGYPFQYFENKREKESSSKGIEGAVEL